MLDALAQSWLTLQCRMLPNVRYGLVALDAAGDGTLVPAAYWPESSHGTTALVTAARLAMSKRSDVVRSRDSEGRAAAGTRLEMACPLLIDGRVLGVVAVELDAIGEQQQRAVMQLLHWGSPWLDLLIRQETTTVTSRLITLVQVVSSSIEHARFEQAAAATVSALARQLDCVRVSLGMDDGAGARLLASSMTTQVDRRSELVRDLEACMVQALDEGRTLQFPPAAETDPVPSSHDQLAERHGPRALLTVPLVHGERVAGAITFERKHERAFDAPTVELCEALAGLLGPILDLKHEQDRPALQRMSRGLRLGLSRVFGPHALLSKVLLAALVALPLAAALVPAPVRVDGEATLEGRVQQSLVAPLTGFVSQAPARAGDLVRAGDLLAELDARDLRLERRRIESEHDELAKEHRRALAKLEGAEGRVLAARMAQAQARLALIDEQLSRVRLLAPFDGVVVSGDLSQSLGAPVEQGQVLYQVAPLDEYRVVINVEDRDVSDVRAGQIGVLTLAAMPGERHDIVIERVRSAARVEGGRNVFRVEANLSSPGPYLRPGMIGVAKIEVRRESVLDAWTHEALDRARLWLWARLP